MASAFNLGKSEILASFRRAEDDFDLYRVRIDGSVLRIEARGHWNLAASEAYSRDITRIVAARRLVQPSLRAIVDRSEAPVFEAGVPERLLATYRAILRAGDRIAMVVASSLVKGHIRRVVGREGTQSFLSISAATTWLLAYE